MSQPTLPKRLQVIERIITVLKAISAGSDYFYSAYEVNRQFKHWDEINGSPTYSVHSDSGGEIAANINHFYDETFYVVVKGVIDNMDDPVGTLEKSIRDVQKAINTDSYNRADSNSLSFIATHVKFADPPETDNGNLSIIGKAYFEQRIQITISGNFGEL
jgi:flagellin-specific chaperone FliS